MDNFLISTRDTKKDKVSYSDVLLHGLAPDGGLYVPAQYPKITLEELLQLKNASYDEIAFSIKKKLMGGTISDIELKKLLQKAYSNEKFNSENGSITPIRPVEKGLYIQNLSLGPTAAFKDMALQQLAQEINYELHKRNQDLVILGATSGDTGSSAEAAFKGLDRIKLFMLSPLIGMSDFQKAQMGYLTGGNIFNISIDGRFDDCQDLVKELKKDPEFSSLGAVNSINWGRLSSQVPYFVSGYLQVTDQIGEEVDFVVPTGNFGNILSGYIAKKMGVPIRRLIVATNENDVVARLINTGIYETTPAQITSSPSMDISKASNYERLAFELLGNNPENVSKYMQQFSRNGKVDLSDYSLNSDVFAQHGFYAGKSTHDERLHIINKIYEITKTIIDPHTADAVNVAMQYKDNNVPMIAMETALPVKFEDTIKEALGFIPEREERFRGLENQIKSDAFFKMDSDSSELKNYLRNNI